MNIEMTERDKKLLMYLAMFVLVVCIGYFGVIPNVVKGAEYNSKISEEEKQGDNNELIKAQLPLVEANNAELEKLLSIEEKKLYSNMSNDEIGRLLNELIEAEGLKANDMSIGESSEASLKVYRNSLKAVTGESVVLENADALMSSRINSQGILVANTEAMGESRARVSCTSVYIRVTGDMEGLYRLIDSFAKNPGIRIAGFSNDNGELAVMEINLQLYMREE